MTDPQHALHNHLVGIALGAPARRRGKLNLVIAGHDLIP